MRIRPFLTAAVALVCCCEAATAAPPVYRGGVLTCPDGTAGKTFMPQMRPSAQDLANACALRTSQRQLMTPPAPHHQISPPMSHRQLDDEAAKLIGQPK